MPASPLEKKRHNVRSTQVASLSVPMFVFVHVCMTYVCMYVRVCLCVLYVCTYVLVSLSLYVTACACICLQEHDPSTLDPKP